MSEVAEMTRSAEAAPVIPERVSPLDFGDIDCVCRTAKALVATCSGCGQAVYSGLHLPNIAYGFWCTRCCPCSSFVPSPEEAREMARRMPHSGTERRRPKAPKVRMTRREERMVTRRASEMPLVEEGPKIIAPWETELPPPGGRKSESWMPRVFVMKLRQFDGERQIVYDLIRERMPVTALYELCAERGIEGRAVLLGLVMTGAVAVHWSASRPR